MRSSCSSLISSVLLKSTRESRNDPFCIPLLKKRKEMGDSVTCLPMGKKGSWGCSSGFEEQVGGAELWDLLSPPGYRPGDIIWIRSHESLF